jgi:hypothetical protein
MENFKIKNKIFFEAGGKREVGGDDKLTFFLWGLNYQHSIFGQGLVDFCMVRC